VNTRCSRRWNQSLQRLLKFQPITRMEIKHI